MYIYMDMDIHIDMNIDMDILINIYIHILTFSKCLGVIILKVPRSDQIKTPRSEKFQTA
jgi:hypothetical protein